MITVSQHTTGANEYGMTNTKAKAIAKEKITKRMRETMTFWWCRKCECLYTEANAHRIIDEYFCPWDGTQLEPDTIREPKTDTLGEA